MAANSISQIVATIPGAPQLKRALVNLFGSTLSRHRYYTITISPTIINAGTCSEQTFTCTGVNAGDVIVVNKPTQQAGLGVCACRASAANQIAITFVNPTAGNVTPTASQVYKVMAYTPTDLTA
jgi:hypothetical protein